MKKYLILFTSLLLGLTSCSSDDPGTDPTPPPPQPETKGVEVYLTVRNNSQRLTKQPNIGFSSDVANLTIRLDSTDLKQEIEGFGGSLTGSSAYLIKNMSETARVKLLNDLFTDSGIALKYLRLTIGSSDFSLGNYTYCDENNINSFAIPATDKRDLLPVLKQIVALNKNIKLMGSPWTAPAWMKKNQSMNGGSLIGEAVYNDFSDYFVKYIQAYKNEGITIDAISLQNEPHYETGAYPTMYMEWNEQNRIIRDYIGPKFKQANIKTKILIWDHNFDGYDYPSKILDDTQTKEFVAGVAFHGYNGSPADLDNLLRVHPDVPLYFTEQSGGGWNTDDAIGNMLYYMKSMLMPTINKGSRNFLMWNIALDRSHGPVTTTSGGCQDCRGIVTINDNNAYTVNEEYYLLGHFSKFIKEGAHRIKYMVVGTQPSNLEICSFLNPDGSKVVVVLNQTGANQQFTVRVGDRRFTYTSFDQSVVSFVYK